MSSLLPIIDLGQLGDVCSRSSATKSPPSSSQAAAIGLAARWLQRRGDDYFEQAKYFLSL